MTAFSFRVTHTDGRAHLLGRKTLHRSRRPDRHERGCLDRAAIGVEATAPRGPGGGEELEADRHGAALFFETSIASP